MTIKDLIKELKKYDPETPVTRPGRDGYPSDIEYIIYEECDNSVFLL